MSIRDVTYNYTDAYVEAYRGDTIFIPIQKTLDIGATYDSQLRKNPNSVDFFTLEIVDNKVIIPSITSESLVDEYVLDVQETKII